MNGKILVIDDDPDMLDDYREILSPERRNPLSSLQSIAGEPAVEEPPEFEYADRVYDLATSSSGEDGVRQVERSIKERKPFAVVFCDMRMPGGMDGLETGKRIRRLDRQVEIVFITGYSDHENRKIVSELGSPEKLLYLKKPFHADEIRQLALKLTKSWWMERNLKKALEQARAAEKAKSDFLSLVTHEFKTPLTGIVGSVETLRIAIKKNNVHKYARFLDMVECSVHRLVEMVNEILLFARAESHKIKLQPETFNLKEFFDSLASEEISPLINGKRLDYSMDIPSISIYADKKKLRHIILNLISNAIKFTNEGAITVKCFKNGDKRINFAVSDTGRGIPEDLAGKIFEEFYQVNRNGDEQQGTGLGLAIVKKYVRLHGGSIRIESREGAGATFHFDITEPAKKRKQRGGNRRGNRIGAL
ncbi:MAG: hypothetical protein IEMM0002_1428 [bacterium]|nr:MAG: hypothetical protein IEMM0002_1428 [bacterium]